MSPRYDISKSELAFYGFIWCISIFYAIYSFAVSCNKNFHNYEDGFSDFTSGWSLVSRNKDNADSEWRLIKFVIWKCSSWAIAATFIAELLRSFKLIEILQWWQITISLLFLYTVTGIYGFGIIFLQFIIFSLALLTYKKAIIWMSNISTLILIIIFKRLILEDIYLNLFKLNEQSAYLLVLTLCWTNLRSVSYCIDIIDNNEKLDYKKYLSYCLYLPTLIMGPFISYTKFRFCYDIHESLSQRLEQFIFSIFRYLAWYFFIEFCLHYIYVNAIAYHIEVLSGESYWSFEFINLQWIEHFNSWSLYGYGYAMGQFFQMKYVVSYGFATTFAKFENIPVPRSPICIARVHLYSDMWKYFDEGLYNFLTRYIYIPLFKYKIVNYKLIASLTCFIFVFVWHGTEFYIFIWSALNYVGIIVENASKWIFNKLSVDFGDKWNRRISCALGTFLFAMSIISNFIFFSGFEIGCIFFKRIIIDKLYATSLLFLILYTGCQISEELRRKQNREKQQTKTSTTCKQIY